MVKGLVAGTTNLVIALALGAAIPVASAIGSAAVLGFVCYGVGLVLFIIALRNLGTARAGAYFAVAPYIGATLSMLLLGDAISTALIVAGALMAVGVWLHLSEQHAHSHDHEALAHTHSHAHGPDDDHHDHFLNEPILPGTRHSHAHIHRPITHFHPHVPDSNHAHMH